MARVYGHIYQTAITEDCNYKFIYQELGGQTTADILHKEECWDEYGMHYNYLPVCGASYRNTKYLMNKIDSMPVPVEIKNDFRQFVEDCIRYGREMSA